MVPCGILVGIQSPCCSTPQECLDVLGIELQRFIAVSLCKPRLTQLQMHKGPIAICCCHGPVMLYCLCIQFKRLQGHMCASASSSILYVTAIKPLALESIPGFSA